VSNPGDRDEHITACQGKLNIGKTYGERQQVYRQYKGGKKKKNESEKATPDGRSSK